MDRKTCKTPMCIKGVWRNGYFTTSDYCWEHDPIVIETKHKVLASPKQRKESN